MHIECFGKISRETGNVLNSIAGVLKELRLYKTAASVLEQSLRISLTLDGEAHFRTAISYQNLADAYLRQGHDRKNEAIDLLGKSHAILIRLYGEDDENVQEIGAEIEYLISEPADGPLLR